MSTCNTMHNVKHIILIMPLLVFGKLGDFWIFLIRISGGKVNQGTNTSRTRLVTNLRRWRLTHPLAHTFTLGNGRRGRAMSQVAISSSASFSLYALLNPPEYVHDKDPSLLREESQRVSSHRHLASLSHHRTELLPST